jgi:hypothetical protein
VPASFHSAALGPQLTYDSRDSNYYPRSGQYARVSWLNYGKRWGGDFEFDKVDAFYNHYLPVASSSVSRFACATRRRARERPSSPCRRSTCGAFPPTAIATTTRSREPPSGGQKFTSRWGAVAYAEAGRFSSSAHNLRDGRTSAPSAAACAGA